MEPPLDAYSMSLAPVSIVSACAGLSFDNRTGDGVYKRNLRCGITASSVHDGFAKAASLAAADDDGCGPWDAIFGGYREACRGDAGNLGGFSGLALADAERTCCATAGCEGFSFDNATGNGVFKNNLDCGITTSATYGGYAIRKAPAPLPRGRGGRPAGRRGGRP